MEYFPFSELIISRLCPKALKLGRMTLPGLPCEEKLLDDRELLPSIDCPGNPFEAANF